MCADVDSNPKGPRSQEASRAHNGEMLVLGPNLLARRRQRRNGTWARGRGFPRLRPTLIKAGGGRGAAQASAIQGFQSGYVSSATFRPPWNLCFMFAWRQWHEDVSPGRTVARSIDGPPVTVECPRPGLRASAKERRPGTMGPCWQNSSQCKRPATLWRTRGGKPTTVRPGGGALCPRARSAKAAQWLAEWFPLRWPGRDTARRPDLCYSNPPPRSP